MAESIAALDPFEAESVVEAFRRGTVPSEHLHLYTLGRDRWLQAVARDLDFVSQGGSKVRFLAAPYGGGKTHFLKCVTEEAHARRFLVSYVELHSREAPLDRFEVVLPKLMRQLRSPAGLDLQSILESWARTFPHYQATEIESALRDIAPSLDFRSAMRALLQFAKTDSPTHRGWIQGIVSWLEGTRPGSDLTKVAGVRMPITIANVSDILASFLRLMRSAGYSGLVLMLDEAEAITSLSQSRKRDEANQNIRKLLDNADENSGLYVLFATTPAFLEDSETGAQTYPALWSRIRHVVNSGSETASSRSVIMTLPAFQDDQLKLCGERLIKTHENAYQWDATAVLTDDDLSNYVERFLNSGEAVLIRPFIRGLIYALDMVEESNGGLSAAQALGSVSFDAAD